MASDEFNKLSEQLSRIERGVLLRSKDVLTIEECAMLIGTTSGNLYRMTSDRTIPFYKPMGGKVYFRKEEIERWMLRNRQPTKDEVASEAATFTYLNKGKGVGARVKSNK
ncbi:MAG: helix-turn-helix domain-containing protein [Prevotella sp.]|nr:helix-turn-helix domain-containing protein [Prevotella sp.]MBR3479238.1 helix-turn-helix domain-containing protein [Prevotella sp.]